MPQHRFYCPIHLHTEGRVTLPEWVARHALGALRMRHGDPIVLFSGDGSEFHGVLEKAGKHAEARLHTRLHPERESGLDVVLVQGISSNERMDFTLQKAVELGVQRIVPVSMRRSVVRLDAEKRKRRREHWQAVVASACEQCGRNWLPEVAPIEDFADWIRHPAEAGVTRYLLDPEGETRLRELGPPDGPLLLIAGPEGGFDDAERDAALAAGCRPLRLGPRILRTETAAMAALAAMQALWGDL